jgi:hypothetical protein
MMARRLLVLVLTLLLAAGAPFESVGAVVDPGAVSVVYGSAAGLIATGGQAFWQGTGGAARHR